jgi:hypothetical protein
MANVARVSTTAADVAKILSPQLFEVTQRKIARTAVNATKPCMGTPHR